MVLSICAQIVLGILKQDIVYMGNDFKTDLMRTSVPTCESIFSFQDWNLALNLSAICWNRFFLESSKFKMKPKHLPGKLTIQTPKMSLINFFVSNFVLN